MKKEISQLRSFYFSIVGPGALLLVLGGIYEQDHSFGFEFPGRWFSFLILGIIMIIAYILPMWMRMSKIKNVNKIEHGIEKFMQFQKSIILLTGVSIYFAPIAFIFDFPDFPKFGVAFAAIYALYTSFPNEKKMKLEKKIFRVGGE